MFAKVTPNTIERHISNRQASIANRPWIAETDIAGVGHLGAIRRTVRSTLMVFTERGNSFVAMRTLTGIGGLACNPIHRCVDAGLVLLNNMLLCNIHRGLWIKPQLQKAYYDVFIQVDLPTQHSLPQRLGHKLGMACISTQMNLHGGCTTTGWQTGSAWRLPFWWQSKHQTS